MNTVKIELVKSGRVWIQAKVKGYACKLKMCEQTKDLEMGVHELVLKDISIRSKYGTDIRYECVSASQEKVFFSHHAYNSILVDKCRDLGGVYDKEEKVWVFPAIVEDKVEELEELYNSELVNIELTRVSEDGFLCGPAHFLGYTVARATSRDSGAKLGDNISLISGEISSGGSCANWRTYVSEGAVFRMRVPSKLLETYDGDKWKFERI